MFVPGRALTMSKVRLHLSLRIRQADPKAIVVLTDENPRTRGSRRRRKPIQVGDVRIRCCDIRLDRPAYALVVANCIACHRHHSSRRASGWWARRRRVTGTAQWEGAHQQFVIYSADGEVDTKLAIAAGSNDIRKRHYVAVLIEASATGGHVRVVSGGRTWRLQVVDGVVGRYVDGAQRLLGQVQIPLSVDKSADNR